MPEKAVVIRTMAALGIADVCYGNQPTRGEFLNESDHVATATMELFSKDPKRWPSIPFAAGEVREIGIELLRFLGNLGALLKPLR